MERKVFTIGAWKNFDELEESLTIEELAQAARGINEAEERDHIFHAAIHGIDLNEGRATDDERPTFDDIKERAERRLAEANGATPEDIEKHELAEMGLVARKEDWNS